MVSALTKLRHDYHEFKASLGYRTSSRPALAIQRDSVSKKKVIVQEGKMADTFWVCL
jgi:hypothetical protein